jgi:hypothetical protein
MSALWGDSDHAPLLQKQFLVSADNPSLISPIESDTLYMIQKITHFSVGCCQPTPKMLLCDVGCLYQPTKKINF